MFKQYKQMNDIHVYFIQTYGKQILHNYYCQIVALEICDESQKLFKGLPYKGYIWAYTKAIYVLFKGYLYTVYLGIPRCYTFVNPIKGYLGILKTIYIKHTYNLTRVTKGHIRAL